MPRNVEIRERVGGVFNNADSLLYPKTHINMVEGLLTSGKLTLSLLPDALKTGMKFLTLITTATSNTAGVLTSIDSALLAKELDPTIEHGVRYGGYVIANVDTVLTVSTGHKIQISDDGAGEAAAGSTVNMERGDWLVYAYWDSTLSLHTWNIINNTHGLATTSAMGLMSSSDKTKLDNIAANANNYAHPTQTAIDVNATDNGINVIDRVQVNTLGHVIGVSTRDLSAAISGGASGVMTGADKAKLDGIAANANNYSLPTATDALLGGVRIGTRLSIASGILSADSQTENNFTTVFKNKLDGIAANANNYTHPAYTAIVNLGLSDIQTMSNFEVDATGHITAASKQNIRTGSTTQTGLLQLATGGELTTSLNSAKATSPTSVKTMIDYFAGMKRYNSYATDGTTANAAHADGSIVLFTV